jgi:hypothetical protein
MRDDFLTIVGPWWVEDDQQDQNPQTGGTDPKGGRDGVVNPPPKK